MYDETVALRGLRTSLMRNRKAGELSGAVPKRRIDRGSDEGIKWLQHSDLCGREVNDDDILWFPVQMRSSWWLKADHSLVLLYLLLSNCIICYVLLCLFGFFFFTINFVIVLVLFIL